MDASPEPERITLPATIPSTPAPAAPENPLLQRYRGHRTRTWGDTEALRCLEYVAQGYSIEASATLAGIPTSAAYGQGPGPSSRALHEAILSVYAQEGAAYYEDAVRRVVAGEVAPKLAGATVSGAVIGLRLRGRLRDREAPSTVVNATVYVGTTPPPRCSCREGGPCAVHPPLPTQVQVQVRAREGPGTPAPGPTGV